MYHSQGAGGVSSKSLISKMTFRSGVAKAPNSTDGSRRIPAPGDPCSLRAPDRTPRWRPIHANRRTAIGSSARSGSEPNWVNGRYCFGQASRGDHAHSSAPFTGNAQTGARAFAASFRIAPALTIATRPSIHAWNGPRRWRMCPRSCCCFPDLLHQGDGYDNKRHQGTD